MNAENERHYCLQTLETARETMLGAVENLPKLRAGYDKDKEGEKGADYLERLIKMVKKVQAQFVEVIHALGELESEADLLLNAQRLYDGLCKFKWLDNSYENVCGALEVFANSLPRESNINAKKLAHLMNRVKMGYFPTDLNHVKLIKSALMFPQHRVNILDPCCGCGCALQCLTDGEDAATYGVEIDRNRAENAELILDRVGYGTFFQTRISNKAFHAVFLNPPYLSVMQQGGGSHRAERSFLIDILRYIAPSGILIYIIPYYRLTEDICRVLAENFDDLKVYKFLKNEFKKYKQIVIFGRYKERDTDVKVKVAELLSLSLKPDSIPEVTEIQAGMYSLPYKEIEIKLFKGAEFNVNELALQLKNSDSLKQIFDRSELDTLHRNPILPLKVGQIGLIGGSGLMNGLVECDTPHIIKGRVIKKKTVEKNGDFQKDGFEQVREVTSNRVIFNILTPFGYKQLT